MARWPSYPINQNEALREAHRRNIPALGDPEPVKPEAAPIERGTILDNGARVLAVKGFDRDWVVLAETEGVQPFVTWRCAGRDNTFWGHYFSDISDAVRDFEGRSI